MVATTSPIAASAGRVSSMPIKFIAVPRAAGLGRIRLLLIMVARCKNHMLCRTMGLWRGLGLWNSTVRAVVAGG